MTTTTTPSLNTVYTAAVDVSSLETDATYTYHKGVRKNAAGVVTSTGYKLVLTAPSWLKLDSDDSTVNAIYEKGANDYIRKMLEKLITDGATTVEDDAVSFEALTAYIASIGSKFITKESISETFDKVLAEVVTKIAVARGLEAKADKMQKSYKQVFIKMAAPAYKPEDDVKQKLVLVLEQAPSHPVVSALLARLTKADKTEQDLYDNL